MNYKIYEKLNYDQYYKGKYPKRMWPVLNEFFSRYKYEFHLTDEEIRSKLNRTLKNLKSIANINAKNDCVAGWYIRRKKRIELFRKSHNKYEEYLATLFHELNHAGEINGYGKKTWGVRIK